MPGLDQLRALKAKTPAAQGMTDAEFALAMHEQAYNDVPLDVFLSKNGLDPASVRKEIKPDSPFAKYLDVQGKAEQQKQFSTQPTGKEDVGMLEGLATSAYQGATLGFGDELIAGTAAALQDIGSPDYWKNLGERYAKNEAGLQRRMKAFSEEHPWLSGGTEIAGSLIPGLIAAPFTSGASLAPSVGKAALMAGLSGAAYGYGKAEDPNDPTALISLKRAEEAIPTALLSAAAGGVGAKIAKMVTPTEVNPVVQSAADTLDNFGVTSLTAGQKTGNIAVQDLEQRGGKKIADMLLNQKKELAAAAWNEVGIKQLDDLTGGGVLPGVVEDISKPTIKAAKEVFDNAYTQLEKYPMLFDNALVNDLDQIVADYGKYAASQSGGLTGISSTVLGTVNKIKGAITQKGALAADGKLYGQLYKDLGKEIASASDYPTKEALRQLQEAISEAMRRGIQATAATQKDASRAITILDNLRPSYQKFIAIRGAARDRLDDMFIKPSKLLSAIGKVDARAIEDGTGELAVLAQMAEAARTVGTKLGKLPPEGIPARYTIPGVIGGGASLLTPADPITRGIVGAAAFGASELARKGIRTAEGRLAASNLGQAVLSNTVPDWLSPIVTGTGAGINAAAPVASEDVSRMFGLGEYAKDILP